MTATPKRTIRTFSSCPTKKPMPVCRTSSFFRINSLYVMSKQSMSPYRWQFLLIVSDTSKIIVLFPYSIFRRNPTFLSASLLSIWSQSLNLQKTLSFKYLAWHLESLNFSLTTSTWFSNFSSTGKSKRYCRIFSQLASFLVSLMGWLWTLQMRTMARQYFLGNWPSLPISTFFWLNTSSALHSLPRQVYMILMWSPSSVMLFWNSCHLQQPISCAFLSRKALTCSEDSNFSFFIFSVGQVVVYWQSLQLRLGFLSSVHTNLHSIAPVYYLPAFHFVCHYNQPIWTLIDLALAIFVDKYLTDQHCITNIESTMRQNPGLLLSSSHLFSQRRLELARAADAMDKSRRRRLFDGLEEDVSGETNFCAQHMEGTCELLKGEDKLISGLIQELLSIQHQIKCRTAMGEGELKGREDALHISSCYNEKATSKCQQIGEKQAVLQNLRPSKLQVRDHLCSIAEDPSSHAGQHEDMSGQQGNKCSLHLDFDLVRKQGTAQIKQVGEMRLGRGSNRYAQPGSEEESSHSLCSSSPTHRRSKHSSNKAIRILEVCTQMIVARIGCSELQIYFTSIVTIITRGKQLYLEVSALGQLLVQFDNSLLSAAFIKSINNFYHSQELN